MRAEGIEGVRRTKWVRTTKPGPAAARHRDLVKRDSTATGPEPVVGNRPYVRADVRRIAYVCFIIDAFSRIVVGGGHVEHAHREGARRDRDGPLVPRHPTRGAAVSQRCRAQFTSLQYGERLAEIGAVPSIDTVGDSYDNALAETVNGYYQAELIRGSARPRPWRTVDEVSRSPPSAGSTGTTTSGSTATSTNSRQPSSKGGSTLPNRATAPWLRSNDESLLQTQRDSNGGAAAVRGRHLATPTSRRTPEPP
jgi:transposase InsO family protein